MIDYERLALRSQDEPLDADERAALRVWGDALEAAGDPRGTLIALEHAILDEPERAHVLAQAANPHVAAQLGPLAELLEHRRAVELDWRAGVLVGVFVDVRRLPKTHELRPSEVLEKLLDAPALHGVRRLHVRMRRRADRYKVLEELTNEYRHHYPPLEELVIVGGGRPRTLGGRTLDDQLLAYHPRLRLLAFDEGIVPLPRERRSELPLSDPVARTQLGRELTCESEEIRREAIARVAQLGPAAFAFVATLTELLLPGMPVPQAEVVRALVAIGPPARRALPRLARITGRPAHYDRATRRAAGAAVTALRAMRYGARAGRPR